MTRAAIRAEKWTAVANLRWQRYVALRNVVSVAQYGEWQRMKRATHRAETWMKRARQEVTR